MQKKNNMNIEGRFEVMEIDALMDVQGGNESENFLVSLRKAFVELFDFDKKAEKN